MINEEAIQQDLVNNFPGLADKARIQRRRRIWLETPLSDFRPVFARLCGHLGFSHLCTISGQDEGENLSAIYHLSRADGIVLCLKVSVPKAAPVLPTISDRFPGSAIYEREIMDLLGFQVQGCPPGKRYPLPDDWPSGSYPLRKDWNPEDAKGVEGKMQPEEKSHG